MSSIQKERGTFAAFPREKLLFYCTFDNDKKKKYVVIVQITGQNALSVVQILKQIKNTIVRNNLDKQIIIHQQI